MSLDSLLMYSYVKCMSGFSALSHVSDNSLAHKLRVMTAALKLHFNATYVQHLAQLH